MFHHRCVTLMLIGLLALAGCESTYDGRQTLGSTTTSASYDYSGSTPSYGNAATNRNRDNYAPYLTAGFRSAAREPLSTFSLDVDTASYSHVRRILRAGQMPPPEAVRIEEMVNYFDYDYPGPRRRDRPFALQTHLLANPWQPNGHLLHVAVQGYELSERGRPPANLVFLIDVSGSMEGPEKLGLVKQSLRLLVDELQPQDRISIVTYSNRAVVRLEPTFLQPRQRDHIGRILDKLTAGGGTAGADGLGLAYAQAERDFDPLAVNRIILVTDGDFNIGLRDPEALKRLIVNKRRSGLYLSVLTVGSGNVQDNIAQALAQNGNGQAAHLDSLLEARKVFSDDLTGSLFPIAEDAKIQIEFNPALVREYRLLGYETRALANRDFNNDWVDAGDIGSGHSVTALYELTLIGDPQASLEPLRYQNAAATPPRLDRVREVGFIKLRYKLPGERKGRLMSRVIDFDSSENFQSTGPNDLEFAVAVAGFGQLLRGECDRATFGFQDVVRLAQGARGNDPLGLRGEFIGLVRQAESLAQAY